MLSLNNTIHNYNTRNKHKYHLWAVEKSYLLYSFSHKAPTIWNDLPNSIISIMNYNAFKRNVKEHLIKLELV